MEKIEFTNNGQPAINDTNLNLMQTNIEEAIENRIITSQEYATDEYIDGNRIYRKRILATWGSSSSFTIPCGLSSITHTPIEFSAFLRSGTTKNLFDINTPRAYNTEVANSQTWGYWDDENDNFVCNHQGYSREGYYVTVNLRYVKV